LNFEEARLLVVGVLERQSLHPFPKLDMQHNKKRKKSMLILFGKS
jgi:hypothetical protein